MRCPPDKFLGDDLDQRLKSHGIKTVIVCGTSAQGVGIGTGAAAAQRGYDVIYPVNCLLSESALHFRDYVLWQNQLDTAQWRNPYRKGASCSSSPNRSLAMSQIADGTPTLI